MTYVKLILVKLYIMYKIIKQFLLQMIPSLKLSSLSQANLKLPQITSRNVSTHNLLQSSKSFLTSRQGSFTGYQEIINQIQSKTYGIPSQFVNKKVVEPNFRLLQGDFLEESSEMQDFCQDDTNNIAESVSLRLHDADFQLKAKHAKFLTELRQKNRSLKELAQNVKNMEINMDNTSIKLAKMEAGLGKQMEYFRMLKAKWRK